MKRKILIMLIVSVISISLLSGCSETSKLTDIEQYIYNIAAELNSPSSTVELESVGAFNLNSDFNDISEEYVPEGTYILFTGVKLWDNGAKDELGYEYYLDDDGIFKGIDLSSLDLEDIGDSYTYHKIRINLSAYGMLVEAGYDLTMDEFKNGDLGYLVISDENIEHINEELKKK